MDIKIGRLFRTASSDHIQPAKEFHYSARRISQFDNLLCDDDPGSKLSFKFIKQGASKDNYDKHNFTRRPSFEYVTDEHNLPFNFSWEGLRSSL